MVDGETGKTPEGPYTDDLLDHEYDGIQEYDNPLPRWWVFLFVVTIVVTPAYIVYYHFGPGKLPEEKYEVDMAAYYDLLAERAAAMGEVTQEALEELTENPAMVQQGAAIFAANCVPCHGANGGGVIGPNLTDRYWIHGGRLVDIYHTVRDGVPAKGMVAWSTKLKPNELMAVVTFVDTLRGTDVPGGKPPEGEEMGAETEPAAASQAEAATEDEPTAAVGTES